MRTINVTGSSKISVKPTLMTLSMEISGDTKTFDESVRKSTNETETFKEIIEDLGFKRSDLKTKKLDIDTRTESYRDKYNNYRHRFAGYSYTHKMFLEFPEDNKRLGEIITALVKSKIEFEFSVSYTIRDSEKKEYMDELISEAVYDAKKKAEILAKAAEVELGDVIKINHSDNIGGYFNDNFLDSDCLSKSCTMDYMASDIEFSVDAKNIELSDDVDMIWEIK